MRHDFSYFIFHKYKLKILSLRRKIFQNQCQKLSIQLLTFSLPVEHISSRSYRHYKKHMIINWHHNRLLHVFSHLKFFDIFQYKNIVNILILTIVRYSCCAKSCNVNRLLYACICKQNELFNDRTIIFILWITRILNVQQKGSRLHYAVRFKVHVCILIRCYMSL